MYVYIIEIWVCVHIFVPTLFSIVSPLPDTDDHGDDHAPVLGCLLLWSCLTLLAGVDYLWCIQAQNTDTHCRG